MLDSGVLRHFSQLLTHHRSNIQKVRKAGGVREWSEGKKEDIGLVGKMLAFPSTRTHNIYPSTHSSLLSLTLSRKQLGPSPTSLLGSPTRSRLLWMLD